MNKNYIPIYINICISIILIFILIWFTNVGILNGNKKSIIQLIIPNWCVATILPLSMASVCVWPVIVCTCILKGIDE